MEEVGWGEKRRGKEEEGNFFHLAESGSRRGTESTKHLLFSIANSDLNRVKAFLFCCHHLTCQIPPIGCKVRTLG